MFRIGTPSLDYRQNLRLLSPDFWRCCIKERRRVGIRKSVAGPCAEPVIPVCAQSKGLTAGTTGDDRKVPSGIGEFAQEGSALGATDRDGREVAAAFHHQASTGVAVFIGRVRATGMPEAGFIRSDNEIEIR